MTASAAATDRERASAPSSGPAPASSTRQRRAHRFPRGGKSRGEARMRWLAGSFGRPKACAMRPGRMVSTTTPYHDSAGNGSAPERPLGHDDARPRGRNLADGRRGAGSSAGAARRIHQYLSRAGWARSSPSWLVVSASIRTGGTRLAAPVPDTGTKRPCGSTRQRALTPAVARAAQLAALAEAP